MSLFLPCPSTSPVDAVPQGLRSILTRGDVWQGQALAAGGPMLSSGFAALDAELPGGGWPCAGLVDVLQDRPGIGATALLLPALAALTRRDEWVLLQSPPAQVFAPAWQLAGVSLSRLLVLDPDAADARSDATARRRCADALWAAEQVLRAGSVAMALLWLPRSTTPAHLRRLQLAAESGGALGIFLQDSARLDQPSAAPLRLHLRSHDGALAVHILKRRGAPLGRPVLLPHTLAAAKIDAAESSAQTHALAGPRFSSLAH